MNVKQLVNKLLKISNGITSIEKALVYSFANSVSVDINSSKWLKSYLSDVDVSVVDKVNLIIKEKLTLNELIAVLRCSFRKVKRRKKV